MSDWTKRLARLAGITGLTAVVAVGLAGPASAAAGDTSSTGLSCGGVVNCGPFAHSAFPAGPATDTLASATVAGIVSTGILNTTANAGGATASVNGLSATLVPLTTFLTANTVSSQCTIDPTTGGVSGSSSIVNGVVKISGVTFLTLNSAPAPNTAVAAIPGVASIILNRQSTAADGTLTVDAIFITLTNLQTITVATSTCTPKAAGVPMATGKGLLIGGGLLAMLVLGYAIRRRSLSARQPA